MARGRDTIEDVEAVVDAAGNAASPDTDRPHKSVRKKDQPLYTATGECNSGRIVDWLIEAGAPGKGAFYGAMQQAIENAHDAGMKRIDIFIDRKADSLRIVDDGTGFGDKEFDGFLSLGKSPKEGLAGFIGKNGSGRVFNLLVSQNVRVFTVSKQYPGMGTLTLNRPDLEQLIRDGKISRRIDSTNHPDWWDLKNTGSAIVLEGVDWDKIPAPGDVVRRLSTYLRPSIASKVFVNGKPLKIRPLVGDVISEVIKVPYFGDQKIEFELFVPETRSGADRLRIGGINPICDLREVIEQLAPEEQMIFRPELLNGVVCGDIFVPTINEFRGNDGKSIQEAFYKSELRKGLVRLFAEEINPRIEKAFERKRKKDEVQGLRMIIADLVEAFGGFGIDNGNGGSGPDVEEEGGVEEPPPTPPEKIIVSPTRPTLCPGDVQKFKVKTAGTSGSFAWDAKNCGGQLSSKTGQEVIFTAGDELGEFTLIVRDRKKATRMAMIKINIIPEKNLMVSPPRTQIACGDEQPFRVRNVEVTSGEIRWEIVGANPIGGIRLQTKAGIRTVVEVSDAAQEGEYLIAAFDVQKPDSRAEATFEVVREEPSSVIEIEGVRYLLEVADPDSIQNSLVVLDQKGRFVETRGGKAVPMPVMKLDSNSALLANLSKLSKNAEARRQVIFPHLAAAHLMGRTKRGEEELDEVSFWSRVEQIHRQKMEERANRGADKKDDSGEADPV